MENTTAAEVLAHLGMTEDQVADKITQAAVAVTKAMQATNMHPMLVIPTLAKVMAAMVQSLVINYGASHADAVAGATEVFNDYAKLMNEVVTADAAFPYQPVGEA